MNVECVLCAQIHPQGPHIYDFVDDVDDDLCCSICLSPFLRIRSYLNAMQSTLSSMILRIQQSRRVQQQNSKVLSQVVALQFGVHSPDYEFHSMSEAKFDKILSNLTRDYFCDKASDYDLSKPNRFAMLSYVLSNMHIALFTKKSTMSPMQKTGSGS